MPGYRVIALDPETARKVRETRRAPGYGHPVHSEVATGYGPCRLCLRDFEIGVDRRLLFTCDPFFRLEPYPWPGPVFIHETECDRHPEDQGFPVDLLAHRLTLAAYGRGRHLRAEERVEPNEGIEGGVEAAVARLLARPDVDYVHVRDTEAGCYDFRIEPSNTCHPERSEGSLLVEEEISRRFAPRDDNAEAARPGY
jgi:Protein of unknown function (DUF1203)